MQRLNTEAPASEEDMLMTRYGMVVDITRCNGCYNCFIACRDEHCGNDFPPYSLSQPESGHYWMRLVEKERGRFPKVKVAYTAIPCMHCDEPRCVEFAEASVPPGEPAPIYRRPDGIVMIDPERSVGREDLVGSCPYRVIFWNEELSLPQKCTLCAHLLDQGWKEPRCVEACPTRALRFGDLDDPESEVAQLVASGKTEPLRPEYQMHDKVTYISLPKRFVAGTVVLGDNDACGEGAQVTLKAVDEDAAGTGVADAGAVTCAADNYGDFEFEDLPPGAAYTVTVSVSGYEDHKVVVRTHQDVYLGEIVLQPSAAAVTPARPDGGGA